MLKDCPILTFLKKEQYTVVYFHQKKVKLKKQKQVCTLEIIYASFLNPIPEPFFFPTKLFNPSAGLLIFAFAK